MTPAPGLTWQDLDGELVVLDTTSGRYYQLNPSAATVFRAIGDGQPVDSIVASLCKTYRVDSEQARIDVRRTVADLIDKGMVVVPATATDGDSR